jgi:hypothetical protein
MCLATPRHLLPCVAIVAPDYAPSISWNFRLTGSVICKLLAMGFLGSLQSGALKGKGEEQIVPQMFPLFPAVPEVSTSMNRRLPGET